MGTLVSALNVANEALTADQSALNLTANNVANQNTPGYTREIPNFATQDTYVLGGYQEADGVTAGTATSVRDRVLEQRVQQQTQAASASSTLGTALDNVQSIFGLTASASASSVTQLGTATNDFFTSLTALANGASEAATRQQVLSAASTLANTFNAASSQLTQITSSLNNEAVSIVWQADQLLGSIASLNTQIAVLPTDADAGVLEDQRQQAIAQLSQYIGLDQIATSNNGVELTTSNAGLLVTGGSSYQLSAAIVAGVAQITAGPNSTNVTSGAAGALTGGTLGGTLEALNTSLPPIQSKLDTLAYSIATAVNTQSQAGVDANGNAGQALFTIGATATGAAGTISVAVTDPNLVAAAAVGEGSSGNTNATALAALGTANIAGGDTATGYLAATLAAIGSATANATSDSTLQSATLTQLTSQRDALSGVSLDEEASNLTEYQRSYQAASQLFSIIDTLFASVLNLGVVTSVS